MKSYSSFIFRTVRNGRIKFDKLLWEPSEPTNRLDGKRFAFGVYVEGNYSDPVRMLDILCLWGSVAAYEALNISQEEYLKVDGEDSKLLAPDGYLRQYWWGPVPSELVEEVKANSER